MLCMLARGCVGVRVCLHDVLGVLFSCERDTREAVNILNRRIVKGKFVRVPI